MSASWRLRVERGPNAGQSFPIDQSSSTIGRQDNNTIVLDDARLSRQHARIDSNPGGLTVTDLNSANGTQVNGRPVSGTVPLQAGDRVQLGDTIIVIEGGPAAPGGDADATLFAASPSSGDNAARTPAAEVPRLVMQGSGDVFRLDRPSMVIGRQPENELPLDDTQSSRQHARFDIKDGQVTVVDLGSANGTRVNGSRITAPTSLNNGDVIQIGTSQLRVEGIPFVDNGTAVALGFFPPSSTGPALDAPPLGGNAPLGAPPPPGGPGGFGGPPVEGATVIGGPPPMASMPPPSFGGGPPLSPPGAPGQPWNSPPGPQFGGAPPIQPPMPPAAPGQRKRSPLPLILIGLAALLLLLCVGGGTAAFLVSRGGSDPTATPNASVAGTAVPAIASTTPQPVTGRSGGNTAPPPPGASAAPSSAPAVPTAGATLPSARPSAAAAQPTRSAAPSARPSAPAASGNRRVLSVESIGLSFSIPADWTQTTNEAGRAGFRSPDGQAQIIVRWSAQVPGGLTAQQLIRQELLDTAELDPDLDINTVGTGIVEVGGQQGYGSEPYTFTQQGTTRITEADRAVVLPGEAQYFFGFLALESAFDTYAATFDEIIETIEITGP